MAGGLSVQNLNLDDPGAAPEVWEKVVRKLRVRYMPPAGLPRPDERTYAAMTAHLELLLDRAAASKPNPGSNRHFSPIAATNGSVRMIQLLLKADPETVIGDGETALMTASRSGNLGVVKLQTEHGANVNAKEKSPARQR